MKTESHSIHDVLAKNATSFFVPPFQRAYAWGKPEVERFFNDVSRLIDSELDSSQSNKLEHFFGTLVIKEEGVGFTSKSIIIDGQQRLTTTLLLLIALRDLKKDPNKKNYITNTYLINSSSDFQDKIKLKQVTKDWDAYRALVNNEKPIPGLITQAYLLLKKLADSKMMSMPYLELEHFIIALQRMNVAVIFLDERPHKGEDPQIIFETLNSLGKPLSLADLIRNYILLNMSSNEQTDIFDNIWHPKIENMLQEYTSHFFRDYLQYKMQKPLKVVSDNNTKLLYQEFKDFVGSKFPNKNHFINDIIQYVPYYKWIITEEIPNNQRISLNYKNDLEIKELLRNIFHDIKSEAFKPLVLGLLEYHQNGRISDDIFIETLKIIRTYLIRRRIFGLTRGENLNIVLLCNKIEDIANGTTSMIELLTNLFYALRLPNDLEIEERLSSMNFYEELKDYSKFIFGKMEECYSKVSVNFRKKEITIEHIMPQKLTYYWERMLGENFKEVQKKYLHNIGNLILTEFNGEMGNQSFKDKKLQLAMSNLRLRNFILEKEAWNEQSILEHQTNMINLFLKTFPLPDEYKERNNWKIKEKVLENNLFSPLDEDATEIVPHSKPIELHIDGQIFIVNTWQEVFIEFLKYIKENPEFNFEDIINQQKEIFGREDTIVKWSYLAKLIKKDDIWTNRYKTFKRSTWKEEDNLNDDTLFIHVHISASNCIERIANLMEKFNISKDAVKIRLNPKY